MLSLIVAVDKNWGIGKNGNLLISIPNDMKFFQKLTIGHSIIMGRKTLESFPFGKPLKERENIVLSKSMIEKDVKVFHSIYETLSYVKNKEEVFVIGGSSIYKQFLPYCKFAYITKIEESYEVDSFFPNLDKQSDWEIKEYSQKYSWNSVNYYFCKYENKKVIK